ncbi:MAG: hypothetical protein ACTSRR_09355 [Candidatus Heimdallarchaeaceae archaeon]
MIDWINLIVTKIIVPLFLIFISTLITYLLTGRYQRLKYTNELKIYLIDLITKNIQSFSEIFLFILELYSLFEKLRTTSPNDIDLKQGLELKEKIKQINMRLSIHIPNTYQLVTGVEALIKLKHRSKEVLNSFLRDSTELIKKLSDILIHFSDEEYLNKKMEEIKDTIKYYTILTKIVIYA